eukprot:m.21945 g.21945  ORF g.21945 m.21945 type:complete len:117 (+) comp8778_c0_seq2:487-837(+)
MPTTLFMAAPHPLLLTLLERERDLNLKQKQTSICSFVCGISLCLYQRMALLTHDPRRPGVSLEINTTYVRAAKLNDTVIITGTILKTGGKIGFSQVDITRKSDGELVVTGRHTKAL